MERREKLEGEKVGRFCFIVLWLEIHGVFLSFFLLFNLVASAVTAYNVDFFKKTRDNTWI